MTMINGKKVIVALPAYNAAKTLKMTLDAIPRDVVDDVILVDDASSDQTVATAHALGLETFVHPKNRGYGGNQKTCYREALRLGADIAVMVHPDFQYDPKFIPALVRPIAEGEVDAVFGSRMLIRKNALKGGMPYWKFVANIFLTKLENIVLGMHLTEYHSGFRAYSKKLLETLPIELNSDDFVFDTEIIVQMKIAGFRIKEIPISTRYFPEASMIGLRRSILYGFSILRVMGRFLLHRIGVRMRPQFMTYSVSHQCPYCESFAIKLLYQGNKSLDAMLESSYSITDENPGYHDDIYFCLHCGLAFVPPGDEKKILECYTKSLLDTMYIKDTVGRKKTARRILRRLDTLGLRNKSEKKLLDIGCNAGLFLMEAQKKGFAVYGIEPSERAAHFAQELLGGLSVIIGDDKRLDEFPDGYFDIITAFDVLEHVPRLKNTLDRIYQKLRPGGILIFTAPDICSLFARATGASWHALVPLHLSYISKQFVKFIVQTTSFALVDQRTYWRFLSIGYLVRRLTRGTISNVPVFFDITIPVNLFDELEIYLRK